MNETVKHRIIGAIVLLIMLLSLLPFVLRTPNNPGKEEIIFEPIHDPYANQSQNGEATDDWRAAPPVAQVNIDKGQIKLETRDANKVSLDGPSSVPVKTSQAVMQNDLPNVKQAVNTMPSTEPQSNVTQQIQANSNSSEQQIKQQSVAQVVLPVTKPKVTQAVNVIPASLKQQKTMGKVTQRVSKQNAKSFVDKRKTLMQKTVAHKHGLTHQNQNLGKQRLAHKSHTAPLIKAWVVQLASFTDRKNAISLRNRLNKKGYHAFINESTSQGHSIIRVVVGPEIKREKADELAQQIYKDVKIHGLIVHHSPVHG